MPSLFRGATLPTSSKQVARDKEKSMKKTSSNSRRLLGAFAVGATVVSAVAFAGAGTGMAATGALTLNYSCPFPLLGAQDMTVSISVDGLPDAAVAGVPTSEAHVVATATVGGGPTSGSQPVRRQDHRGHLGHHHHHRQRGHGAQRLSHADGPVHPCCPRRARSTRWRSRHGAAGHLRERGHDDLTPSDGFSTTLTPRTADGSLTGARHVHVQLHAQAGAEHDAVQTSPSPATTP